MTLVKVKNPDLYRSWIRWYERNHPDMHPAARRTYSFFRSTEGETPRG